MAAAAAMSGVGPSRAALRAVIVKDGVCYAVEFSDGRAFALYAAKWAVASAGGAPATWAATARVTVVAYAFSDGHGPGVDLPLGGTTLDNVAAMAAGRVVVLCPAGAPPSSLAAVRAAADLPPMTVDVPAWVRRGSARGGVNGGDGAPRRGAADAPHSGVRSDVDDRARVLAPRSCATPLSSTSTSGVVIAAPGASSVIRNIDSTTTLEDLLGSAGVGAPFECNVIAFHARDGTEPSQANLAEFASAVHVTDLSVRATTLQPHGTEALTHRLAVLVYKTSTASGERRWEEAQGHLHSIAHKRRQQREAEAARQREAAAAADREAVAAQARKDAEKKREAAEAARNAEIVIKARVDTEVAAASAKMRMERDKLAAERDALTVALAKATAAVDAAAASGHAPVVFGPPLPPGMVTGGPKKPVPPPRVPPSGGDAAVGGRAGSGASPPRAKGAGTDASASVPASVARAPAQGAHGGGSARTGRHRAASVTHPG